MQTALSSFSDQVQLWPLPAGAPNTTLSTCLDTGCTLNHFHDDDYFGYTDSCNTCCYNPACFNGAGTCVLRPTLRCPVNPANPFQECGGLGWCDSTNTCHCSPGCGTGAGPACQGCSQPQCQVQRYWRLFGEVIFPAGSLVAASQWDGTLTDGSSVLSDDKKSGSAFKTPSWGTKTHTGSGPAGSRLVVPHNHWQPY